MNPLLTVKQVAGLLNCKPSCVYAWASMRKIPAFKVNGLLRFDEKEIRDWLESQKAPSAGTGEQPRLASKSTGKTNINTVISNAIESIKNGV